MWFLLSLTAFLFWSGSDFFSKLGSHPRDKYSHWKMVMAVGLVMGLHACYEMLFNGVSITFSDILAYLPASALYIGSMVLGYVGLRYIELSVSSPICNCSGALAAVFCFIFLQEMPEAIGWVGVAFIAIGLVALAVVEQRESDEAKDIRRAEGIKYSRSVLALLLPLLYCLLDALGTFIDAVILAARAEGGILKIVPSLYDRMCISMGITAEEITAAEALVEADPDLVSIAAQDAATFLENISEAAANVANVCYELTFLFMAVFAAVYVFVIKRQRFVPTAEELTAEGTTARRHLTRHELPKLAGGICETAGQFAYVFALAYSEETAGFAAAIISSYCAMSVLLSRLLLKEKLSRWHYLSILVAFAGILILGFLDM